MKTLDELRLKIYDIAIEVFSQDHDHYYYVYVDVEIINVGFGIGNGMCGVLRRIISKLRRFDEKLFIPFSDVCIFRHFPELLKYQPINSFAYENGISAWWWEPKDVISRIFALKSARRDLAQRIDSYGRN